jgi:hypothetical protein
MQRAVFATCLALCACASSNGTPQFRVGLLPPSWREVETKGDLAFRSPEGGTIYANMECEKTEDAPLDVLANHLLFGVDVKHEDRQEITLAGRKALRNRIEGEVDGVPVRLDTVVLMKNGCTYDLGLVAGPGDLSDQEAAFDRFIAGFETLEPRKAEREEEGWACSVVPC